MACCCAPLVFLHLCCPEPCCYPILTSSPRALLRPNSSQQPLLRTSSPPSPFFFHSTAPSLLLTTSAPFMVFHNSSPLYWCDPEPKHCFLLTSHHRSNPILFTLFFHPN
ncbi:hypothetical protein AMTRI_Chr11g97570 [Amborella trichopoda]